MYPLQQAHAVPCVRSYSLGVAERTNYTAACVAVRSATRSPPRTYSVGPRTGRVLRHDHGADRRKWDDGGLLIITHGCQTPFLASLGFKWS
eukprot:6229325-Pyramimonas_sp.AAC.1